jgi:hypothetical protein
MLSVMALVLTAMSHSEIGGAKRIYQYLSETEPPGQSAERSFPITLERDPWPRYFFLVSFHPRASAAF